MRLSASTQTAATAASNIDQAVSALVPITSVIRPTGPASSGATTTVGSVSAPASHGAVAQRELEVKRQVLRAG